jgi:hypothetical protein
LIQSLGFELRGDVFDVKVVGVDLRCCVVVYNHAAPVATRRHIGLFFLFLPKSRSVFVGVRTRKSPDT